MTLKDLTESDVLELLELCEIDTKNIVKPNGIIYAHEPVFKRDPTIDIYFYEIFAGVKAANPYYFIRVGQVRNKTHMSIKPFEVIEWFLGKGFQIGNLQLKDTTNL